MVFSELEDAIRTDLGISLGQCEMITAKTLITKIPSLYLDKIGEDPLGQESADATEVEMTTISITALKYSEMKEIPGLPEEGDELSRSFFSTLSNIAQSNQSEISRATSLLNQDCYYSKVQYDGNHLQQLDAHDKITSFQKIFGKKVPVNPNHEHHDVQFSNGGFSSANLKVPHKIISKGEMLYFIYLIPQYTVHDCLMYSPSLYTLDNVKTSFILFQVLKFFSSFEKHFKRDISSLHWNNVEIDTNGWVKVHLPESCFLTPKDNDFKEHVTLKPMAINSEVLSDMLDGWICGDISNFDYLMFLNKLSGRNTNDPNHHPILPWVSTFQTEHSSWRDLTKSKYRLNKGDRQLDIQYSMMSDGMDMKKNSSQNDLHQVPHHVPEYLSDITYYVYTARRTPKPILCKLVRSYWEPNEYPSSIQRMQEWTPDECIPEFYTDPTVFESIHDDMSDLSIPEWSKDPADFVHKHKKMLESDMVSKNLHHWIDITFGYKLSGKQAENEKNVCLPLVDNHTSLRKRGIVQLFTAPHPEKRLPVQRNNIMTDQFENPTEIEDGDSFIQLAKHYNPTRDLQELESLLKFKTSVWNSQQFSQTLSASTKSSWSQILHESAMEKNISDSHMATYVCLMIELLLPLQAKTISDNIELRERFDLCINIFKFYRSNLPTPFQCAMQYFLDHTCDLEESSTSNLDQFFFKGYPPPTLGFLSSRYIHILPFPDYFHYLYEVLEMIMLYTEPISTSFPLEHVSVLSERLQCLFESLDYADDCLQILTPFICDLLSQDTLSAVAFLIVNFEVISKAMGEKRSNTDLLPLILDLYDRSLEKNGKATAGYTEMMNDGYLVLFYEKAILLQLCTRLGLKNFLMNIPGRLANALVSQCDVDVSETAKSSLLWLIDRIGPTLTSKYIIQHLFKVSSVCFYSANAQASKEYQRVLDCLLHAAATFGHSFVTLQYLPFLTHKISSSTNHPMFALRHQAAVESSLVTVSQLITYLTDTILMQELSRMSKDILIPAIKLLGCQKFCFPQGLEARKALCMQVIHLIVLLIVRIGREMSKKHLTPLFKQFFRCFHIADGSLAANSSGTSSSDPSYESIDSDSVLIEHDAATKNYRVLESSEARRRKVYKSWYNDSPTPSPGQSSPTSKLSNQSDCIGAKEEIFATFCAETAYKSYVSFTRLLGGIHMEYVLGSYLDRVHNLCLEHETTLKGGSAATEKTTVESFHTDVMMVGNQLVVESPRNQVDSESGLDLDIMSTLLESSGGVLAEDRLGDCARRTLNVVPPSQLTENWLAYWEHEVGLPENDKHIHFNQIELQSFTGHSNAVRCITCHRSEDWFLSGGRDKTVKIWSVPENIELRKDMSERQSVLNEAYSYKLHKKTINYVGILESEQVVISNDGNIHVWDPYTCQQISTFDNSDVKSGFALVSTLPSPSRYAITVTNDSDLRIVDLRRKCLAHEYKIVVATSMGIARAMCVLEGGNRVVVGFSTGMVSAIDIRMGNKLSIKPAHENDISAMASVSEKRYLTASSDQTVSLWENGQAVTTYRSFNEPVHTLEVFNDEIISGSVSNRIYVHTLPGQTDAVTSTVDKAKVISKLRNDTFRGVLSTFCVLPLKRQLVLASDTGSIKLLT